MNEPVEFAADDGTRLAGTIVTPKTAASFPAALIVNGSGPLDRDSNMPGQKLDVASTIAHVLAEHGIASLRYDKRGVAGSGGAYLTTGFHEETSDAAVALASLRDRPGVDPAALFVIGHSAGATIAIRLASRNGTLAGVVLLCAAARTGDAVMRQQSDRIAASLTGLRRLQAAWFLRRQDRARQLLLESQGDVIRVYGQDLPARWFREYMAYDPAGDLPGIRCPVLAITGGNDIQVDPADVARIGELVTAPFTGSVPDGLTHLLRTHAGAAGLSSYPDQLRQPVDAGLLETITRWIADRSGRAGSDPTYEQA